ncbi:STAS-like domain-containing protein [Hoylesella marshii]|uniref:STAS-like domain-containing protein n=1 Tax=Hoylesella marshii TaxID=189722 RepID=UPI0028D37C87|nr:STAS-like domain-containing protein [Hoylesella marshii]
MCTANIREILVSHSNLPDAGTELYNEIVHAIASGEKVIIDMEGVSSLPSIFLNVSIGKIIDEYDIDTLKKHISFCKITRKQAERLKDYLLRYN